LILSVGAALAVFLKIRSSLEVRGSAPEVSGTAVAR
jgi:hypothetical protein